MLRPMGGVRRRALVLAAVLAGAVALALVLLTGGSPEPERTRPPAPTAPPTATAPAPRPPVDVRAVADLGATPTPAPSMSGFLHSLAQPNPPDATISPLRPRLWRSVPTLAPPARAIRLGARYQFVLSDLWGYPGNNWNGKGPPWRDLAGWERTVRAAARLGARAPGGMGRVERARQPGLLHRNAGRVLPSLRRGRPGAAEGRSAATWWWAGPAPPRREPEWLEGLLRHCRAAGCRVGFLSWHANLQPYEQITSIAQTLRRVRARVLPRYRDVGLERARGERVGGPRRPVPAGRDPRLPARHGDGRRRGRRALLLAGARRHGQLHQRHARGAGHARRATAQRLVGLPRLRRRRGRPGARPLERSGGGRAGLRPGRVRR